MIGWPPPVRPVARLALAAVLVLASAAPGRADGTLSVCLDRASPALAKDGEGAQGFDLATGRALAQRLGRSLVVQPYESETDNDSNPARQVNALLSDGRCQLVLGYPLFAGMLDRPQEQRSRLPGFDGARPGDRRRWVQLSALAASRGLRFAPLVVVLGPGAAGREVRSLADLKPLKLGSEERTLPDAVLMAYGGGTLISRVTHMLPGPELFAGLERGDYDAAIVELQRFDLHRSQHPGTRLQSSGHYHSIGFNIGAIGLASDAPLMAEVDAAINEMLANGELAALARAAGLTWLPPREPNVSTAITWAQLRGD